MKLTNVLSTFLLAGCSIALPPGKLSHSIYSCNHLMLTFFSEPLKGRVPTLCKPPHCTSYCADGTPFDCCVVYIRDPCSDHWLAECTGLEDMDCLYNFPQSDWVLLLGNQSEIWKGHADWIWIGPRIFAMPTTFAILVLHCSLLVR